DAASVPMGRFSSAARLSESHTAPDESPVWFQYGFVAILVAVNVWIVGLVANNMREIPVRHAWYPVAAFQHIHDRGYRGRIVVPFRWAQYAIMAFGADESTGVRAARPRLTVSFDGRFRTCYPQEVVDMCFDFETADDDANRHRSAASAGAARDRILDVGRPNFALIDRANPTAMRRIRGRDDWRLMYEDATAELWARGEAAAGEAIVARGEFAETDRVAWPALPRSGPDVRQIGPRE
ncbi:MAG: hypothetical protein KDA59_23640, partial [Planctomycetales bacterium]|nr:hypothetical protein [Planctomycetales bacterium]